VDDSTTFDRIRKLRPPGRGEFEIADLDNMYIEEGTLSLRILEG
jgi:glucose-1-phosphate thymidylyltransferase